MGDRALIMMRREKEVSPVLYLHWGGGSVAALLQSACNLMADRGPDLSYSFARLVGLAHEGAPGCLSVGCWNAPANPSDVETNAYSHGDAGVFVVELLRDRWVATAHHGYGFGDGVMTRTFRAGEVRS